MLRAALAALFLCLALAGPAAQAQSGARNDAQIPQLAPVPDMLVLDYAPIELTTGGRFDLFGVHYLHAINDWLYAGLGFSAPLVRGNYGGFFSADATLHAQTSIGGNWFVDGGLAFGAGAGGASLSGILTLSGDGTYVKKYAGIGYDFGRFRVGLNYADISVARSPINDQVLNLFFQKPLSYSVGRYRDTGRALGPESFGLLGNEAIISFEYSHLTQIAPTGSYTGPLGLISSQLTSFFAPDSYYFIGLDLGYSGLVWYNQAQGGLGHRLRLSPRVDLMAQVGVGSGGWVTSAIDTGPGLVIYPKVKLEYRLNRRLGATLSAGYLFAPLGTSRNWTLGAGLAYHFPSAAQATGAEPLVGDEHVALKGLRTSIFARRLIDPVATGTPLPDMTLLAFQFDYSLAPNWYLPVQIAAAVEPYRGFAGYVEGMAGLGWQSAPLAGERLRLYGQVLYGLNDAGANPGGLIYPSGGVTFDLDDRLSLYAQAGRTLSLNQLTGGGANTFQSWSVGLGLSYSFSLPSWSRR